MFDRIVDWLLGTIGSSATSIIVVGVFALSGGFIAWTVNDLLWKVRYAQLEQTHAEANLARNQVVINVLENVRALERKGDAIAAELVASEAARTQLAKEKADAIRNQTTGQPCFAAGLVRLLNDSTAASGGFRLPATPGSPAFADSAFATDTDVGLWAATARDAHDACRARIDALRAFYALEPP